MPTHHSIMACVHAVELQTLLSMLQANDVRDKLVKIPWVRGLVRVWLYIHPTHCLETHLVISMSYSAVRLAFPRSWQTPT